MQLEPDEPYSDDDGLVTYTSTSRKQKASVMFPGPSSNLRSRKSAPVLRSAWRAVSPVLPVVIHACDPPIVDYNFTRTIATVDNTGNVTFATSAEVEQIQVAADWLDGEKLSKAGEPFHMTGFIGAGFTKRGVYVCLFIFDCHIESYFFWSVVSMTRICV